MKDEVIKPAEEFLLDYEQEYFPGAVLGEFAYTSEEVIKAMIAFAKAHTKKALITACNKVHAHSSPDDYGNDVFLLNDDVIEGAYPETNII